MQRAFALHVAHPPGLIPNIPHGLRALPRVIPQLQSQKEPKHKATVQPVEHLPCKKWLTQDGSRCRQELPPECRAKRSLSISRWGANKTALYVPDPGWAGGPSTGAEHPAAREVAPRAEHVPCM